MPCFHPIDAYRSAVRGETGKYGITFNSKQALIENLGSAFQLPCGKCIGCRIDRSRQWAVRCMHEAQMHPANCFLTLTYDEKKLPDDYSISLDHYQKFLKRLRISVAQPLRFFGCAEYGSEEGAHPFQPHYHFLIFNYRPTDLKLQSRKKNIPLYTSEHIQKLWKYGYSTVGEVNYQTAAYCARYVIKKIGGDKAAEHYTRVHPVTGKISQVKPEFATQSRRPGLGASWLAEFKADIYPSDFVVVDGKKHPIPKFYTRQLQEEEQTRLKRERNKSARLRQADNTHKRLRDREQVQLSRVSALKRNLK